MGDVLKARVIEFMVDNDVFCEETIYQTDRVIENAYDFIADLFKLVEPELSEPTPPSYEDLSDYFKSKGATVSDIHYGRDSATWFTVTVGNLSVDVSKHRYYYMTNKEKRHYLKCIKGVLEFE